MASSSGSDTPSRRMSSAASTPSRHRKSHSTSAIAGLVSARKPTSSGLAAVAEGRKSSNESDTPLDPRDALEDVSFILVYSADPRFVPYAPQVAVVCARSATWSAALPRRAAMADWKRLSLCRVSHTVTCVTQPHPPRSLACHPANTDTRMRVGPGSELTLTVHTPLLTLLARHAASLSKRASTTSLPAGDEFARHLSPEIDTSLSILQGVTLLSRNCKAAVGERWAMEVGTGLLVKVIVLTCYADVPRPVAPSSHTNYRRKCSPDGLQPP